MREPYLGDRSTRDGGVWGFARDDTGSCQVENEIERVFDSIEGDEHYLASSLLDRMMSDAETGRLRFGEHEDIAVIQRVPDLLELRLQINPENKDLEKRFLLRLYFAEPPDVARLMLALKFGKKPRAGDPGGRQNRHINEARQRYDSGRSLAPKWGILGRC